MWCQFFFSHYKTSLPPPCGLPWSKMILFKLVESTKHATNKSKSRWIPLSSAACGLNIKHQAVDFWYLRSQSSSSPFAFPCDWWDLLWDKNDRPVIHWLKLLDFGSLEYFLKSHCNFVVSYFSVTLFGNCQECCKNPESPNKGQPQLILHSAKGHNVQLYLFVTYSYVFCDFGFGSFNNSNV